MQARRGASNAVHDASASWRQQRCARCKRKMTRARLGFRVARVAWTATRGPAAPCQDSGCRARHPAGAGLGWRPIPAVRDNVPGRPGPAGQLPPTRLSSLPPPASSARSPGRDSAGPADPVTLRVATRTPADAADRHGPSGPAARPDWRSWYKSASQWTWASRLRPTRTSLAMPTRARRDATRARGPGTARIGATRTGTR